MSAWWLVAAWADPAADLAQQRELVDRLAASVAEARVEGLRRELATRMADYRAAAARLEELEASVGAPAARVDADRRAAVVALREALVTGADGHEPRATVAAWLGDPEARIATLTRGLDAAGAAPSPVRAGVLLDVIEQSDALAVLLSYDAAREEGTAEELALRAASLRRRAPGQTASMAEEIEAVRLTEQAAAADARHRALDTLRDRVSALRERAATALREEP